MLKGKRGLKKKFHFIIIQNNKMRCINYKIKFSFGLRGHQQIFLNHKLGIKILSKNMKIKTIILKSKTISPIKIGESHFPNVLPTII